MLAEDIADFHPSTAPDGETLVIYILSTVPRRTLPKSFPHFNSSVSMNVSISAESWVSEGKTPSP